LSDCLSFCHKKLTERLAIMGDHSQLRFICFSFIILTVVELISRGIYLSIVCMI
jgi:hypothetical protein